MEALQTLGISNDEKSAIFSVLGAILHLRYADATQGQAQRSQFIRMSNAQHAATLLGVSVDHLSAVIFKGKTTMGNANMGSLRLGFFINNHQLVYFLHLQYYYCN